MPSRPRECQPWALNFDPGLPANCMSINRRNIIAWFLLFGAGTGTAWSLVGSDLPKADFTFINPSEVKSVDPALITGQPEGRIASAIFEGLLRFHPETLEPIPGMADRWEISDDGLVYTFHIRENAKWSDGSPLTARDFLYSIRRFLDPRTAAEYSYQAWYLKNGRRYNIGGSGIAAGDDVEVELNLPMDAVNTLRGKLVHGKLVRVDEIEKDVRHFVVETDEGEITYCPTDDQTAAMREPPKGGQWCRQVLLDFREVGIEVVDDHTLKLTLEHPTPYFLGLTAFYPLSPVNQKCLETYGTPTWTLHENIVSNGTYKIEFRRIRDRIRLVKNEHHWDRENVKLDVIDVLSMESSTTGLNMFMTDEVDWITDVPPPALRVLLEEKPPRDDVNPQPYLSGYYYYLNTTRKPFNDVRVRKALSMALNREEITTRLLPGGERPCYSLVPPGIKGYEPQKCAPENPEEARRLLAEAGYPEGRGFPRIDILYNVHEAHQTIAELVRKQWQKELGISVRTRNEEWGTYLSSLQTKQYNVGRRGWIADYNDPNTYIDMFVTDSEQNVVGWSNAKYDELVRSAMSENDPTKRFQMLEQAERILMDEQPIIPLYSYVAKNMVKPYVRGLYTNSRDDHPLWAIWIDHDIKGSNEFMRSRR